MFRQVLLIVTLVATFYVLNTNAAMTEKQIAAAGKLVRNVCQPKNKASDEDIEKMHKGDWDSLDKTAKCYMHCVLMSNKLMNADNHLDLDTSMNLAKTKLPASMREATISSIEKCKDSAITLDDKCIAGWEIAKCIYLDNPGNYFLP